MSEAQKVLESASRRELQALAKELQLCRGNAKSDVIVSHAMQFLEEHPKDGEQRLLGVLGGSSADSTPSASPVAKEKKEKTMVVKVDTSAKQSKSDKQQPEDDPIVTVKSVEVVQTNAKVVVEKKKITPKKKNAEVSKEAKKVTPKDKKKAKQMSSPAAPTTKSGPSTAVKSPKATAVKASPSTKKSPTSKTQPSGSGTKEQPAVSKKPSPVGKKKTEIKGRKALEALVKSVPDLTFSGDARVRCSTTGHEMKADVDVINAYIHGKRYQKARNLKLSFAKYAPMFVDHPDEAKPDLLWCNVTESAIARDVKRVEAHIAAPKYQKELPLWKEQEAAKKKAEEEEAQRRAARIAAAKKRRLEAESGADAAESERPTKRKRSANSARK